VCVSVFFNVGVCFFVGWGGGGGGGGGHALAQSVEALSYKSGGRGFNSPWYYGNFSLT